MREGGRWCLEDSLPMTLESDLWLTEESSGFSRGVPPLVMERARVWEAAGLWATVAWAWARVGWVAGRAVLEVEMREAVGGAPGFWWACERVWALAFRLATWRATEGEVGEVALLLLSLVCDCEFPIPRFTHAVRRRLCRNSRLALHTLALSLSLCLSRSRSFALLGRCNCSWMRLPMSSTCRGFQLAARAQEMETIKCGKRIGRGEYAVCTTLTDCQQSRERGSWVRAGVGGIME